MDIILESEIPDLGNAGDVIKVAPGYANNYLIPKGLAIPATKGNLKQLEARRSSLGRKEAAAVKEAKKLAEKFKDISLTLEVRVGDEGKLYGSVTPKDIAEAIAEQISVDVDRRRLVFPEHAKEVGVYEAKLKLHSEVEVTIPVEIKAIAAAAD